MFSKVGDEAKFIPFNFVMNRLKERIDKFNNIMIIIIED